MAVEFALFGLGSARASSLAQGRREQGERGARVRGGREGVLGEEGPREEGRVNPAGGGQAQGAGRRGGLPGHGDEGAHPGDTRVPRVHRAQGEEPHLPVRDLFAAGGDEGHPRPEAERQAVHPEEGVRGRGVQARDGEREGALAQGPRQAFAVRGLGEGHPGAQEGGPGARGEGRQGRRGAGRSGPGGGGADGGDREARGEEGGPPRGRGPARERLEGAGGADAGGPEPQAGDGR